jgi:hypothetical protein
MNARVRLLQFILFFLVQSSFAQIELETVYVSRNKTTKAIPAVRYYYYPNLQAYYDTCIASYIYQKDGEWITAERIAPNYRGYSLYNNNYVILDGFTNDEPYLLINEHKKKYPANYSSKRRKDVTLAQN